LVSDTVLLNIDPKVELGIIGEGAGQLAKTRPTRASQTATDFNPIIKYVICSLQTYKLTNRVLLTTFKQNTYLFLLITIKLLLVISLMIDNVDQESHPTFIQTETINNSE
jgi:hypothetical protein